MLPVLSLQKMQPKIVIKACVFTFDATNDKHTRQDRQQKHCCCFDHEVPPFLQAKQHASGRSPFGLIVS